MSSEPGPILDEYRYALKNMPDERLVMELVTVHHDFIDYANGLANDTVMLDRYNAAKAEVLARMDYEAGRPK
jgi:hypothetical protein